MAVTYEWDIESWSVDLTTDPEEWEVEDHDHADRLAEYRVPGRALDGAGLRMFEQRLVLVRDSDHGREWAYVEGARLPPTFLDAYERPGPAVPARFRRELERFLAS